MTDRRLRSLHMIAMSVVFGLVAGSLTAAWVIRRHREAQVRAREVLAHQVCRRAIDYVGQVESFAQSTARLSTEPATSSGWRLAHEEQCLLFESISELFERISELRSLG